MSDELPEGIVTKLQYMIDQGFLEEAQRFEKNAQERNPGAWKKFGSVFTEKYLKQFITQDPKMLEMKNDVRKLSPLDYPVLINGPSGTGKELIARALHGSRAGQFVAINCTSLPDYLLESELFGHVRGAFTGAERDKAGLFQTAFNGTIFLDEIGDMPANLQAKLLRVLQDKRARKVGDNTEYEISARIVCATNVPGLEGSGLFRRDLYERIAVFVLQLTTLADRRGDIPLIIASLFSDSSKVDEFLDKLSREINKDTYMHNVMMGNVRYLQRIVLRYQVLGRIN